MRTPVFTRKLDSLPSTLELFRKSTAPDDLVSSLAAGEGVHAISIGSGGSAISSEYFAKCRETLSLGHTTVLTPMQAVLGLQDLSDSEAWLFSAGGNNPDAIAAARSCLDRNARSVYLVTCNPDSTTAAIVNEAGGQVHILPVAEQKDGYLATHSLISTVLSVLLACDVLSKDRRGRSELLESLSSRIEQMRSSEIRSARATDFSHLRRTDTILAASDPNLRPLAVLLDTSLWEAALCHVQSTDFRNLAHGRHAWLHHRPEDTLVLGLTGNDSLATWERVNSLFPEPVRRMSFDYGSCGRYEGAASLVDGLGMLEAIGETLEVDPGKPGIGEFGRKLYNDESLSVIANELPSFVRHKRAAIAKSDRQSLGIHSLFSAGVTRLQTLSIAKFGAAVFDYDGTILSTLKRWSDPETPIVDELIRLHSAGLVIGIATGRGGSVGESLRKVLPPEMLKSIEIGYYNGGLLRSADVDIKNESLVPNPSIVETANWLKDQKMLFLQPSLKVGAFQISINFDQLCHPFSFLADLAMCPPYFEGRIQVVQSGHSFDIVPATSSKMAVVSSVRSKLSHVGEVLCIGDSGSRNGNDHQFISHSLGVSVGDVCGSVDGCWSLFGASPRGPDALLTILRALKLSDDGFFHLNTESIERSDWQEENRYT